MDTATVAIPIKIFLENSAKGIQEGTENVQAHFVVRQAEDPKIACR